VVPVTGVGEVPGAAGVPDPTCGSQVTVVGITSAHEKIMNSQDQEKPLMTATTGFKTKLRKRVTAMLQLAKTTGSFDLSVSVRGDVNGTGGVLVSDRTWNPTKRGVLSIGDDELELFTSYAHGVRSGTSTGLSTSCNEESNRGISSLVEEAGPRIRDRHVDFSVVRINGVGLPVICNGNGVS